MTPYDPRYPEASAAVAGKPMVRLDQNFCVECKSDISAGGIEIHLTNQGATQDTYVVAFYCHDCEYANWEKHQDLLDGLTEAESDAAESNPLQPLWTKRIHLTADQMTVP